MQGDTWRTEFEQEQSGQRFVYENEYTYQGVTRKHERLLHKFLMKTTVDMTDADQYSGQLYFRRFFFDRKGGRLTEVTMEPRLPGFLDFAPVTKMSLTIAALEE